MASNNLQTHSSAPLPSEKQLKQTLKNTKYVHASAAAKQIVNTLGSIADLKPSVKEHTFSDGRRMDLMQLSGTMPVKTIDKQYNVPVRLWLPRAFPKERPLVYIKPSPDLALAGVEYVDEEGGVELPYLKAWKEGRADLPTLITLLRFKFEQLCPVYQIRVASFSFGTGMSGNSTSRGGGGKKKKAESKPVRSSIADFQIGQMQEIPELKPIELGSKDREISSYKKTIETLTEELKAFENKSHEVSSYKKTIEALTEELDGLRSHVRGLEQAKLEVQSALAASGSTSSAGQQEEDELVKELEEERLEKEQYKNLYEEEKEKFQNEIVEKEKIAVRLDSKISDLTQTREKVAILEVEKEDYQEKFQRTVRELKHAKTEVRGLISNKRMLKTKISTLEVQLEDLQEKEGYLEDVEKSPDSTSRDFEISELQEKVRCSESKLEETTTIFKEIELQKQQLVSQLNDSTGLREEMAKENKDLRRRLSTALQLYAATEDRFNQADELTIGVSVDLIDSGIQTDSGPSPGGTEPRITSLLVNGVQDPSSKMQAEVDEEFFAESRTNGGAVCECADKEVQVDTLMDVCTQYKKQLDESNREMRTLKESVQRSILTHRKELKEAEGKIHQLLNFKEQLTKKNTSLSSEVDRLKSMEFQSTMNGTIHSTQDLDQTFNHRPDTSDPATAGKLQKALAKIEELNTEHLKERDEMRQRLTDAIVKVKEREMKFTAEISDLKLKLDSAQKQLWAGSDAATTMGGLKNTRGAPSAPEGSIVSFVEIESISPHKLDEGTWGYMVEASFRGTRVAVHCLAKESLAKNPIDSIHRQIKVMAHVRHPNLALFVGVAMDAPSGVMIVTELLTCSLRQAYQSDLIKPDKLPTLLDVARGLNFLHLEKKPIVHNALTSCCVLAEEGPGGQWRAKLANIGSSTPLMSLSSPSEREVVYLAPELETSHHHHHTPLAFPSVDVYSYGVLMYEVATCSLPDTAKAITGSLGALKERLPQITFLVQSCMTAEPERRPTMGSLVKKIHHLVINKIQVP